MIHSFDVVRDPWISVRGLDENLHNVSIREVLKNAHIYNKIEDSNSQYEYGIYNLLLSFLYSVFPLVSIEDKGLFLERGCFDISLFDAYIDKCERVRPNCFNLFGENPFYQNINMEKGKKPAMVGKIALNVPSGNNSIHWSSEPQVNKYLSFEETAKALCSYGLFQANQDGPNSANNVNGGGGYPEYYLLKGENLFQQLIFNMLTETTWKMQAGENSQYNGNAAWEDTRIHGAKEEVKLVSLTEGMTFQNRFVLLNEITSQNLVKNIYFGPGRYFKNVVERKPADKFKSVLDSTWRQPNGIYYIKKVPKGKNLTVDLLKLLFPYENNKIWLDMPLFFTRNDNYNIFLVDELVRLISQKKIKRIKNIYYSIYYTSLAGSYLPAFQSGVYENYIPYEILTNSEVLEYFNSMISFVIDAGRCIFSDIVPFNLRDIYYTRAEAEIIPKIFSVFESVELTGNCVNDDKTLLLLCTQISKTIKSLAKEVYNSMVLSNFSTKKFEVEKNKRKVLVGFYGKVNTELAMIMGAINKKEKERGFVIND